MAFLDDGTAVAESPFFRSRGSAPPEPSGAATSAYEALEAELLRRGWEPDGRTPDTWFAKGFIRRIDVSPARVDRPAPEEPRLLPQAPEPGYAYATVAVPPQQVAPAAVPNEPAPVAATAPAVVAAPVTTTALVKAPASVVAKTPVEAHASRRRVGRAKVGGLIGLAAVVSCAIYLGTGHRLHHDAQIARAASPVQPLTHVRRAPVKQSIPRHTQAAPPRTLHKATPRALHKATPRALHKATPRALHVAPVPPMVDLRVSAPARSSWLEVHRGSAQGRILFAGELSAGRMLRLRAPKLWARFGAAGNLSITANGRRIPLQGTVAHTFVPSD